MTSYFSAHFYLGLNRRDKDCSTLPYKGTKNVLSCPTNVQRKGSVVQTRDEHLARILSNVFKVLSKITMKY